MADSDPQQELKKRARRRLVGALAMALAAAIILPMVMDGEPPQQVGSDLQIKIPSQEGSNFTSRTIKAPTTPVAAVSQPSSLQSEASAPGVEASGVDKPMAKPDDNSMADTMGDNPPKASTVAPPKANASDKAVTKKVDAKEQEDARARAILEGRTAAVQGDKAEVFYVQLGVYRDAANAKDVQTKAAAHGVKSLLVRVGNNTRVRTGPFAERAAADAVVAKLKQAGLTGFVATK